LDYITGRKPRNKEFSMTTPKTGLFSPVMSILILLALFSGLSLQAGAQAPLTVKDLDIFSWRHIGPWTFSGRITSFAVPSGQSKVYYAATASGGVWKTEDHGISFRPIFDKYGTLSIGFLAVAPSNPDILYLGTGEPMHARSSSHGNGMWKSTDAGKTWAPIGLEKSFFIAKVAVHPENPDIVYAAAEGKLYDNEMDCERGLYKTTDGGRTWSLSLDLGDRGVGDFVMNPLNPEILIAAAYKTYRRTWTFIDRQPGNHLYKTTDGGRTWKKLTQGLPLEARMGWNGLDIYPRDPNIVYARLDEEVHLGLDILQDRYLFRRGLFRDGFHFNRFKTLAIPRDLARLVVFEPLKAESERDLTEKLNELIRDKDFASRTGVDFKTFNAAAKKIYAGDKDMMETVLEFEKTLAGIEADRATAIQANRFVLETLKKGAAEGAVHPEFEKIVKFEAEKIASASELWTNAESWAADPDLLEKLGLRPAAFAAAARKIYKDDPAGLEITEKTEAAFKDLEAVRFRYQTVNRYILQVLYGQALARMAPVVKAGVIYRSEDMGESWTRMTDYRLVGGSDVVNQIEAGYSGRIYVDPNNDKVLYAVEVRVMKSEDGGVTFKALPWNGPHQCHVDTRGMWIDPQDSDHILNANDGGVSETWDGGKHWSQKDTISAQQFYKISVDQEMPYNVMGGTQDNGSWLGPSQNRNVYGVYPADWTYLPSGDGFTVVRDWWNPDWIYFESQFGASRRMNLRTGEMIGLAYRNTDEERAAGFPEQRYQWDAPIVLSPHNPGIVYIGSQHVFRSLSRGEPGSWEKISPDLSRADPKRIAESKLTNLQYATIYTFAESPKKPGILWAGTDDGNLQVSTDHGNTWRNVTASFYDATGKLRANAPRGAVLPWDRWVQRVTPSHHDSDVCYVAYSGYRTHNEDTTYVFRTRDMGRTWEDLSGGMMNPVWDIKEDPDNPKVLYLGTEYGVFITIDGGGHWVKMSESAPDAIVMDMDIQKRERDLAVGTYGRGFYIVDIQPFKEFSQETFDRDAHLFEPQRVIKWNMLERRGQTYGEFAKTLNPPNGANLYYWLKGEAKGVKILIRDASGRTVQELNASGKSGLNKIFWNLRVRPPQEDAAGTPGQARMGAFGAPTAEAGRYTVALMIGDTEAGSAELQVMEDPERPPN
jgi:photosystem II stability/assembly factor-like uncharacterized protein